MLWYRIRIDDPQLASSASVWSLLDRTLKNVRAENVAVTRFEGIWKQNTETFGISEGGSVLAISSLYEEVNKLVQVVWGRFFLLGSASDSEQISSLRFAKGKETEAQLAQSILASKTTICVADNSSYFVFTPSLDLTHELMAEEWPVEVKKGQLQHILGREEY